MPPRRPALRRVAARAGPAANGGQAPARLCPIRANAARRGSNIRWIPWFSPSIPQRNCPNCGPFALNCAKLHSTKTSSPLRHPRYEDRFDAHYRLIRGNDPAHRTRPTDGRELRSLRLEATGDGKSVLLIEIDERKPGIHREVRYEITPAELIAAIRSHGAEPPGENHGAASLARTSS